MARNPSVIMNEAFDADVPLDLEPEPKPKPKPKVKKKMATVNNKVKTLNAELKVARTELREAKTEALTAKRSLAAMVKEHKLAEKPLMATHRVAERGVATVQKRVNSIINKVESAKSKA